MPDRLRALLKDLDDELATREQHGGSRYVGQNASRDYQEHIAKGGTAETFETRDGPGFGAKGAGGKGRTVAPRTHGGGTSAPGKVAVPGMTKALAEATASAGGYAIPVQLSDRIADLIRARTVTRALGATVIEGVLKQEDVPSLTAAAQANWTPENAHIPTSQETFGLAGSLIPKPLAALVPVSRKLLLDSAAGASNLDIDAIVTDDITKVVAIAEDVAFLNGSGTGEPKGVMQVSGTTTGPSLGTNGAAPTFDNLIDIVAALQGISADLSSAGWAFNPRTLKTLLKIKDSQGRYLWEEQNLMTMDKSGAGGTLLGFVWRSTTSIPIDETVGTSADCSTILFGDWAEVFIGESVVPMTVDVSSEAPYTPDGGASWVSTFQAQQVLFRLVRFEDALVRRPQLFVVTPGVRP